MDAMGFHPKTKGRNLKNHILKDKKQIWTTPSTLVWGFQPLVSGWVNLGVDSPKGEDNTWGY